MAKGSGSVGGRRGGVVEDTMTVQEAKSISTKGQKGSKPSLGTKVSNNQSKVTNGKKSNK